MSTIDLEKIDTVERLVPASIEQGDRLATETYQLHQERYVFAGEQMRSGRVLDIACGVGYGSAYIAGLSKTSSVTGVDLSEEAIAYARARYANEKSNFICQDAITFTAPEKVDTVISLETIEHVPDLEGFLAMVRRNLAPNGIFITSIPLGITSDVNPHHVHDFTENGFLDLMAEKGFMPVAEMHQIQRIKWSDLFKRGGSRLSKLRPGLPAYYLKNPMQLVRRVLYTLRHGLNGHYLVMAWR